MENQGFAHSGQSLSDHSVAYRYSGYAATFGLVLAFLKLLLYWFTGSMVVLMSAVDSIVDSGISLMNRFVIRYARNDADDEQFPYGRGKAESLAALVQGTLILGGGGAVVFSCVERLISPLLGHAHKGVIMSWHMVIFFVITGFLSILVALLLKRGAKRHNSPALHADSEHYRVDFLTNLGNAVAILAVLGTGWIWLDPLLAGLFAVYSSFGGWRLIRESLAELMDADVSDEVKQEAIKIIMGASPLAVNIHNFRGRKSGHRYFFDFHLTLPSHLPFFEVHQIIEKVEEVLKERFQGGCVVHADPDCLPIAPNEKLLVTRNDLAP